MSSSKFFIGKEKNFFSKSNSKINHSKKKNNKDNLKKHCEDIISCCLIEKPIDCCTPQFLILDKLRQGWSDVSTTGGANIPKELAVQYLDYDSINSSVITDLSGNASVVFNNVYDRCGNKVLFPGAGLINFNYNTYNDVNGNSMGISVVWKVSNQVYQSGLTDLLDLGTINANYTLYVKYYAYFYYTTEDTKVSVQNCNTSGLDNCTDVLPGITENLYKGWRGMSWSHFIENQIPYSGSSVNNGNVPDFGFGTSSNGQYIPPAIIPTGATVYSHIPTGSYDVNYDNALWAYLFVNTHRYSGIESCGKLDQVIGWYVNIYTNQLILLQNLPELGLTTTDNLLDLISIPLEDINLTDLTKLKELNKFYKISLNVVTKVKMDPKEQGNIIMINEKCSGDWLVAVNTAKSNISWTDNTGEYVIVMSKLC
jgi:hypothetical protein